MANPGQRVAVTPHVDQLLRAVLMQMRMNFSTSLAKASDAQAHQEVMELGKKLTSCLVTVRELNVFFRQFTQTFKLR